jgi:hypothetical protein
VIDGRETPLGAGAARGDPGLGLRTHAIDEAGARTTAAAFIGRSAALGTRIEDIEVTTVRQETRGPVPGWAVEIHGKAVMQDETGDTTRAYRLFTSDMAGEVMVEGQG